MWPVHDPSQGRWWGGKDCQQRLQGRERHPGQGPREDQVQQGGHGLEEAQGAWREQDHRSILWSEESASSNAPNSEKVSCKAWNRFWKDIFRLWRFCMKDLCNSARQPACQDTSSAPAPVCVWERDPMNAPTKVPLCQSPLSNQTPLFRFLKRFKTQRAPSDSIRPQKSSIEEEHLQRTLQQVGLSSVRSLHEFSLFFQMSADGSFCRPEETLSLMLEASEKDFVIIFF